MSALWSLTGGKQTWGEPSISVAIDPDIPRLVPVEPSKHPNPAQAATNLDLHQGAVRSHCAFFAKKHTMVALRNGR